VGAGTSFSLRQDAELLRPMIGSEATLNQIWASAYLWPYYTRDPMSNLKLEALDQICGPNQSNL
jgi:hypothetical protein